MDKLAIFGGHKVKQTPYGTGNRFGEEELLQLKDALNQQTLFYWLGNKTKELTKKFADIYGTQYCSAASSGTAAIHTALGALAISPGDEVITSPITDVGTVIGIYYQGAVPVFADVDPHTYNMTAQSVESCITERTTAIVVVHLAGNPADIVAIKKVADKHGLKLIEDCAQSYMCYFGDKLAGTFGDIGCFSLNDFKHISAGDGGLVITDNEELYHRSVMFADKNYKRREGANMRAVEFLAPNYRINELTSAVGIAQLDKLKGICEKRNAYGDGLTEGIAGLKGIYPHKVLDGGKCSYWFYMLRIDQEEAGVSRKDFVDALNAEGVNARLGYIPSCVYTYPLIREKNVYPGSNFPFISGVYDSQREYPDGLCPVAEEVLNTAITLSVSEFFTAQDLADTIAAFKKVHAHYCKA